MGDLTGKSILIVEDEYVIAYDLTLELQALGATIVGPFGTVSQAEQVVDSGARVDVAVLDIRLRHEFVYKVADQLSARGVPILFATGFDADVIPERYRDIARCEKPIAPGAVGETIGALLQLPAA